jgi:hypothetical protein
MGSLGSAVVCPHLYGDSHDPKKAEWACIICMPIQFGLVAPIVDNYKDKNRVIARIVVYFGILFLFIVIRYEVFGIRCRDIRGYTTAGPKGHL